MRIYIAGKITGEDNYKKIFDSKQKELEKQGYTVVNPAKLDNILGPDFTHEEYMKVCLRLIELCDYVYLLDNWQDSKGARQEKQYAERRNIGIIPERSEKWLW